MKPKIKMGIDLVMTLLLLSLMSIHMTNIEQPKNMEHNKDYGEHSIFPVFSGK